VRADRAVQFTGRNLWEALALAAQANDAGNLAGAARIDRSVIAMSLTPAGPWRGDGESRPSRCEVSHTRQVPGVIALCSSKLLHVLTR
jgi:hypothetical protein